MKEKSPSSPESLRPWIPTSKFSFLRCLCQKCTDTLKQILNVRDTHAFLIKMETPQDVIRRYWREKKRTQRASKKKVVFEPHITEFQHCALCGEWHPIAYVLATGRYGRVSLDSYHSRETILNFVRDIDASLHRDKTKADAVNERNLKMCMLSRMQLYNESEHWARANCMIILEDKMYRHFPEGLTRDPQGRYDLVGDVLVPVEICKDLDVSLTKDPTILALGRCFTEKMKKNPSMDPQEAVEECMSELRSTEQGDLKKPAVGDLFGKSAAEIRAMSKRKQDPSFTVGDLSGLTQKQILRMQRHGWDQDDNAAFEACVREKMEKEHMTRKEAEEACEALSATTADRAR